MMAARRTGYDLVSADSHVIEPGDLFETRLPKHLGGRAPRMATSNGCSEWRVEGVGPVPVEDLTDIDWAPLTGYSTATAEAKPGWGYVFETDGGDGYARYGAVRVTHVGKDYLILDWAFQTDRGNPELVRGR